MEAVSLWLICLLLSCAHISWSAAWFDLDFRITARTDNEGIDQSIAYLGELAPLTSLSTVLPFGAMRDAITYMHGEHVHTERGDDD